MCKFFCPIILCLRYFLYISSALKTQTASNEDNYVFVLVGCFWFVSFSSFLCHNCLTSTPSKPNSYFHTSFLCCKRFLPFLYTQPSQLHCMDSMRYKNRPDFLQTQEWSIRALSLQQVIIIER